MKYLLCIVLIVCLLFASYCHASQNEEILSAVEALESAKQELLSQLDSTEGEFFFSRSGSSGSGSGSSNSNTRQCTSTDNIIVRTDFGSATSERLSRSTQVTVSSSKTMNGLQYSKIGHNRWIASQFLRTCSSTSTPTPTPVQPTRPTPTPTTGSCQLMRYSHPRLINKVPIIDVQFRPTMDKLVRFAEECRLKIYVTSDFRTNTNVAGAIVTPAQYSNHMVGQALDFNLQSDSGSFCNGDCLSRQNTFSKCFTDKVQADRSMRWGNSFNDPVHVDSGLNVNNRSAWNTRYQITQQAFKNGCY